MDYSKDMCPRTLEILRRTVYINLNPDWTEEELKMRIDSCQQAKLLNGESTQKIFIIHSVLQSDHIQTSKRAFKKYRGD